MTQSTSIDRTNPRRVAPSAHRRTRFALLLLALAASRVEAAPPKKAASDSYLNLAFVLLKTPALPKADAIAAACRKLDPKIVMKPSDKAGTGAVQVMQLDVGASAVVTIALMPMPVPNKEADEAAPMSLSSGDGWTLGPHAAHLVVSLRAPRQPGLANLQTFTSLLAAVVQSSPGAVAVYWGNAGATHSAEFFTKVAAEPGIMPRIVLWTGFSAAPEGRGRMSVLSRGMEQLGLPDLLLTGPIAKQQDVIPMLFDLLSYVAERGKALPEGDTVGPSPTDKWVVRYVPSPIDAKVKVWRVDLP